LRTRRHTGKTGTSDEKNADKARGKNVARILTKAFLEFAGPDANTSEFSFRVANLQIVDVSVLVPDVSAREGYTDGDDCGELTQLLNRLITAYRYVPSSRDRVFLPKLSAH